MTFVQEAEKQLAGWNNRYREMPHYSSGSAPVKLFFVALLATGAYFAARRWIWP
jgi:hypothetical protein